MTNRFARLKEVNNSIIRYIGTLSYDDSLKLMYASSLYSIVYTNMTNDINEEDALYLNDTLLDLIIYKVDDIIDSLVNNENSIITTEQIQEEIMNFLYLDYYFRG